VSDEVCVKVWVHTCEKRVGTECLERTLQSIRESDVGEDFEVCVNVPHETWSRTLRDQYMDPWWKDTLLRKSKESTAGGKRGYVLRFEDDVIVNRHILHNVKTWPALDEPKFGVGDLFNYDQTWPDLADRMRIRRVREDVFRRLELDQVGSQGQLLAAAAIPAILAKVGRAHEYYSNKLFISYDLMTSRPCAYAGYGFYAHIPSLVNCHDGCRASTWNSKRDGLFSHKNFDLDWKREVE